MRLRNPIIALILLVSLGAYVYLVEMRGAQRRQAEREASEKIFPIPRDQMKEILLRRGDEEIRLERGGEGWRIQAPVQTGVDENSLDRLLDTLESLRTERDLGVVEDLSPFDLASPTLEVGIRTSPEAAERGVFLGTQAPTGGQTYARRGEDPEVLLVSGAAGLREVTFFSLRDKSLFSFDPAQITGCRLVRQDGEIALARVEGEWRLTAPVLAPADRSSVSELLVTLSRLKVSEFLDEDPSPDTLRRRGLKPARVRVVLSGEEWEGERELPFGEQTEEGLLAHRPGSGALVRVPEGVESTLARPVTHFRQKYALPFSRFEIERLRIHGLLSEPLVLIKQAEEWSRESPMPGPVDRESVDLLLKQLHDLRAEKFLDGSSVSRGRRPEPPLAIFEFWKAPEGEGEPAVIEIGPANADGDLPVRNPAWPSVMMVDASAWGQIPDLVRRLAPPETEIPPEPEASEAPTP